MVKLQVIKRHEDFQLYLKTVDREQVFLVGSITNQTKEPMEICKAMYQEIVAILDQYDIHVFHERVFGSLSLYDVFDRMRRDVRKSHSFDCDVPYAYMDGAPYWGEGIAGVNIHGVLLHEESSIMNIAYQGQVVGRKWINQQGEYLMLHGVHSEMDVNDPCEQAKSMFTVGNAILMEQGYTFKEVIRTWIYLHRILDQYDAFNVGRTAKFREFGLLPSSIDDDAYEAVYMPASTGISCNNPYNRAGEMDILAVKPRESSTLVVTNETGKKQKSAFRYGSAFSRAMLLDDAKYRYIYLSGTASINDLGETVYLNDIAKQINMTGSVISALAKKSELGIRSICEGTVFLKEAGYIDAFNDYIRREELTELPFIITVADVCRDNLLFEIDATLVGERKL